MKLNGIIAQNTLTVIHIQILKANIRGFRGVLTRYRSGFHCTHNVHIVYLLLFSRL